MAASGIFALRFTAGRFKGGEFPLRPNREIVIGRGSEYDMVLDEDMVSRRHAKIATMHGQIVLQDLKSTNGTFVNGERITVVRLKAGDKVLIGTSIMEVVEVDRSASHPGAAATREAPSVGQLMPAPASGPPAPVVTALGGSGPASNPPSSPPARPAPNPASAIARTEAAMPVLRLNPGAAGLPAPPSAAAAKATLNPAGPSPAARQTVHSQPPGSLVPVPPAPEPPPTRDLSQGMSGRFPDDDVGLTDLIELFHTNKRTGVLVVTGSDGAEARLAIRDGKLYHASIRSPGAAAPLAIDPTKAVYRVLTWPSGDFRLDTRAPLPMAEAEIQANTRELVIEALRQWDELRKYQAHLPAREQQVALARPLEARLSALSAEALDTLQLVLNHGQVGLVLDHSAASDLETSQDLLYLLQNGYIQVG